MEENKPQTINFFKKVWYSITKFEKYPEMATEGLGSAIKYLAIISLILTFFVVIGSTIEMNKLVQNVATYIEDNIPEFSYENNQVTMQTEEPIVIDDIQYPNINKIVIETKAETDSEKQLAKQTNEIVGTTIYFFKNQILLAKKQDDSKIEEQSYSYKDFIAGYTQENITSFNKAELIEYMRSANMNSYYMRYAMSLSMYLLVLNILVALLDVLQLAVLGWITAFTARIKMRFVAIYNMAVYSLTLSMILNIIYVVINYFTKFTIEYFQVAYIAIAYIYLAATIFILKDDFMKKQEEISKIKEEQKKVREEINQTEDDQKQEKTPEEKKEEDKKQDNDEEETTGSEA